MHFIFSVNEMFHQIVLQETRTDLEYTLIRIEGLISLVVDVEHQRVTMRTLASITPKQIAEAISDNNPNMEARLVTRNKYNQEFLVQLVSHNCISSISLFIISLN